MLLVLDVGNSNTVVGLYPAVKGDDACLHYTTELAAHWRITTPGSGAASFGTADEFGVLLRNLFSLSGHSFDQVTGVAISSVVPPLDSTLRRVCEMYFPPKPLFVEPGVKTGLPILTDNPAEAGADRICNCVAAYERFKGPCIVVDLGTATTFEVISARGEFIGGAIAPGLGISADALFRRAARLPRIEIRKPAKVIGTGTVDNLQIGLYYGYIGLVDGILERMLERFTADLAAEAIAAAPPPIRTIATGGLARLIADGSRYLEDVDEHLTLTGLRLIYERDRQRSNGRRQERTARRG